MKPQKIASRSEVEDKILNPEIDTISFDIFDTLLCRPVIDPADLFFIVERRLQIDINDYTFPFSKMRKYAVQEARKRVKNNKISEEVTIPFIYKTLGEVFGIEKDLLDLMRRAEIDTEKQYLKRRKSGAELYKLAKKAGKKIVLISDMYLNQTLIKDILKRNKYEGFSECIISCEYGYRKSSGNLYRELIKAQTIIPGKCVHIGDNYISDIQRAREVGLDTIYLPSAMELFFRNHANKSIWERLSVIEPSFRLIIGMIANRLFDDPFSEREETNSILFDGSPKKFGYYAAGPWLLFMMKWLIEDLEKEDTYATIHMAARDGYIPMKIYAHLKKNLYPKAPPVNYLPISRSVSLPASMQSTHTIIYPPGELQVHPRLKVRTILKNRFLLEDFTLIEPLLENMGYQLDQPPQNFQVFVEDCMKDIEVRNLLKESLSCYQRKIREFYKQQFQLPGRHAMFDIGFRGQTQSCLTWAIERPVDGYYFLTSYLPYSENKNALRIKSYLGSSQNYIFLQHITAVIMELCMSDSRMGTMRAIRDKNGSLEPVWDKIYVNEKTIQTQKEMQKGVLNFVDDMINLFKTDFKLLAVSPTTSFYLMSQFMNNPLEKDAEMLSDVMLENGSTGGACFFIAKDDKLPSWWRAGHRAIYGNPKLKINNAYKEFNKYVSEVTTELSCSRNKKNILWIDYAKTLRDFDFIRRIVDCNQDLNYLIVNNYYGTEPVDRKNAKVIIPPEPIFQCNRYSPKLSLPKSPYILATMKIYAAQYYYWLQERQNVTYDQALAGVVNAFYFTEIILNQFNSDRVLIWNEFFPLSRVARFACELKEKPIAYLEYGVLPGTIQLDILGQVGENWITRQTDTFNSLPIFEEEKIKAKKAIRFYQKNRLNSRKQPEYGKLTKLLGQKKRKIVFLAGHNNYSSGVFPYDENSKNIHSPLFRDSWHMFDKISKITMNNNWFLIFKPHPLAKKSHNPIQTSEDYLIVDDVNVYECIDLADVVVTVLSQLSYIALLQEKPVIMLGFSSLYKKGCSYEVFQKNTIHEKIQEALNYGFTGEMKEKWTEHVARLLRYYLFLYDHALQGAIDVQSYENFATKLSNLANSELTDYELSLTPFGDTSWWDYPLNLVKRSG